jgi:effector-binding domain-containing protein
MRTILTVTFLFAFMSAAHAVEQAFPRTEPGEIEVKTIPGGRLLECSGDGDYFDRSNNLFGPLFGYIKEHDIAMTTPVEARINPGTMYFWVSEAQAEKADGDSGRVRVIDVEERLVAAIGIKGGYSRENFDEASATLLDWIAEEGGLEIVGEPYAIYWNGPVTPWFMKKSEVQVQVTRKPVDAG